MQLSNSGRLLDSITGRELGRGRRLVLVQAFGQWTVVALVVVHGLSVRGLLLAALLVIEIFVQADVLLAVRAFRRVDLLLFGSMAARQLVLVDTLGRSYGVKTVPTRA